MNHQWKKLIFCIIHNHTHYHLSCQCNHWHSILLHSNTRDKNTYNNNVLLSALILSSLSGQTQKSTSVILFMNEFKLAAHFTKMCMGLHFCSAPQNYEHIKCDKINTQVWRLRNCGGGVWPMWSSWHLLLWAFYSQQMLTSQQGFATPMYHNINTTYMRGQFALRKSNGDHHDRYNVVVRGSLLLSCCI